MDAGVETTVGVTFIPEVSGTVRGIRFWNGCGGCDDTDAAHTVELWSAGSSLGSASSSAALSSNAWNEIALSPTIQVTAGTPYIASRTFKGTIGATSAYFPTTAGAFAIDPRPQSGFLTAPGPGNGLISTTPPSWSSTNSNYWVDVDFMPYPGR